MRTDLRKMMRFVQLISENKRIRVARLIEETGLSKTAVYRWIGVASAIYPIRLEDGVVIRNGRK